MRLRISASLIILFSFALAGCNKQLPAEEEATARKINTLKRGKVSDAEWSRVFAGKIVYETYCSGCHGIKGDGKGFAADMLDVKPRNFTKAMFKFISTPGGSLPTDQDLHRTLLRGVARSSMPSWVLLSENDRTNVIAYLKTFSEKWQTATVPSQLAFGGPPKWLGSPNSIVTGKIVYGKMGCANCHGETGLADGQSSQTLTDADGNKILPFNFHDGILKGGSKAEDIYRTFYTGLAGTPMPAYGGIVSDEENWHLVSYVVYLMGKTRYTENDIAAATLSAPKQDTAKTKKTASK